MATINMTFSLHCLKVAMYNTRPKFKFLQLVHKRQYGFFERFELATSTHRCCEYKNSYKGSARPIIIIAKDRNVSSRIIPRLFLQQMFFHTSQDTYHCVQSSHDPRHCWNCGRDTNPVRELFFCDCGVVQKPANELTYFDLMQMKPSFDIDIKRLGDIFKETQKKLHPDKFSGKTQAETDLAQQQSALLNKAYNTLQKPLSRAIYLLHLQNIDISEKDNFTEPEFLTEIMDINEQISNVHNASDTEGLEKTNDARIANCVKEISNLYSSNNLDDMKRATIKLRYYTTIQERVNELKRSKM
uniref:J domain-containing protein n=2 Tax=Arion vulgaris TaxID=1028688 RepID=A0A0B6ZYP6_9EUPU